MTSHPDDALSAYAAGLLAVRDPLAEDFIRWLHCAKVSRNSASGRALRPGQGGDTAVMARNPILFIGASC